MHADGTKKGTVPPLISEEPSFLYYVVYMTIVSPGQPLFSALLI